MILDQLSSDPDIQAGNIVVRGTRVNFHVIANAVEAGNTNETIRKDYGEQITDDAIAQCVALYKSTKSYFDDLQHEA